MRCLRPWLQCVSRLRSFHCHQVRSKRERHLPFTARFVSIRQIQILEVTEIKSIPYVPLSHPFVERLIGTIRSEYLDHMLFWTTVDLENKLLDFRTYFNNHRTHTSREGRTPDTPLSRPIANLHSFQWQPHCRVLYQTPVAA
jgi:putative transposase